MNECETKSCCNGRGWSLALVALAACLIFAALVFATRKYTQAEPLGNARAVERKEALHKLHAEETLALENVGWIDQAKGLVRLPIADAMKLAERQWQNPAKARAELIARAEKANEPPPKAPEQPSEFE
ncbi:MAG TPA: hypothetical protein PKA41_11650 [Verrucomicrobiota bacterium]|nr:hypothetical protein [Verrucomicrobiota bacterium]